MLCFISINTKNICYAKNQYFKLMLANFVEFPLLWRNVPFGHTNLLVT